MAWWLKNNLRMVQNNLRDIDANMDIDYEISMLKEMGANVVQLGCGGITAHHPSALLCQYKNPYMTGDPFGTWVQKCHENGIRVIARFDFSKTHESLFAQHPSWYVKSIKGEEIRYHDTVATCVNGPYQQNHSIEILEEVLDKYPIDGVFFNMFGYQTRDYSGNYTGICQCDSCKRRFLEKTGLTLPTEENPSDPVFQRYMRFKEETVGEILYRINAAVKAKNPDVAISTYNHQGVDIIRNESNSAIDRALPFWAYQSSDNVMETEGSFADKISSNVAINAVDLPYRFMGVSKHLNQMRLYGNIAAGSGLDWCIIGSFQDYPDRENFESTKEVFQFHKRHEQFFGAFESPAKILLVRPNAFYERGLNKEFRGIFKMLKEEHRLFRVVERFCLKDMLDQLNNYDIILFPGLARIEDPAVLQALKTTSSKVVATGLAFEEDPQALGLFGLGLGECVSPIRGAYLKTDPKSVFESFEKRDWVYLDMRYRKPMLFAGTKGFLPLVSPARFGPPERCYGHEETGIPGVTVHGRFIYFPFMLGSLYYQHGYEDFKFLLRDVLAHFAPSKECFCTNAPPCVETFFDRIGENRYLFQMLNLSGLNGISAMEPLPIHDLQAEFADLAPTRIFELAQDGTADLPAANRIHTPVLTNYKAYVIET